MSWTKRQLIGKAYETLGYSDYVFDLEPERLESARATLDAMMAMWNGRGVQLGYPISDSPADGDLDTDSRVPDKALEAVYYNLAVRLAPSVGKELPAHVLTAAHNGFRSALLATTEYQPKQRDSRLPAGAGYRRTKKYIDDRTPEQLDAGDDGPLVM